MTHSVYHLTVKKSYLSTTVYHIIYNTSTHMKTALFVQNFNAKLPTLIPKTYTVWSSGTQHIKISLDIALYKDLLHILLSMST